MYKNESKNIHIHTNICVFRPLFQRIVFTLSRLQQILHYEKIWYQSQESLGKWERKRGEMNEESEKKEHERDRQTEIRVVYSTYKYSKFQTLSWCVVHLLNVPEYDLRQPWTESSFTFSFVTFHSMKCTFAGERSVWQLMLEIWLNNQNCFLF